MMFSGDFGEQEAVEPDDDHLNINQVGQLSSGWLAHHQELPPYDPQPFKRVRVNQVPLSTANGDASACCVESDNSFASDRPSSSGLDVQLASSEISMPDIENGHYILYIEDLSRGFEKLPISCVNDFDQEVFPIDSFLYSTSRLVSHRASSHMDYNTCHHCECASWSCGGPHAKDCICGRGTSNKVSYGYDESKLLRVFSYPKSMKIPNIALQWPDVLFEDSSLFECSFKCRCGVGCSNRVVQAGLRHHLQVFRASDGCWAVRTLDPIQQGEFVVEYVGELLTVREAEERIELGEAKIEHTFFLWRKLKGGKFSSRFVLDSTKYGNVSRFIRHSVNPNLVLVKVVYDDAEVDLFHVAFFAARNIAPGEEITLSTGHSEPKDVPNAVPFDPTPHGLQNVSKSKLSDTIRKHSHHPEGHHTAEAYHFSQEVGTELRVHPADHLSSTAHGLTEHSIAVLQGGYTSREAFFTELSNFLKSKDKTLKTTKIGGKQVDFYTFYHEVVARGGLQEIITKRRWREISRILAIPVTATSAASELRRNYANYLYEFEQLMVFGITNPPEISCKNSSRDHHGHGADHHNSHPHHEELDALH
eukprot:TRINITY_DN13308_c0_g1_i1.p1 TRINITY_DN13308_c0_g1~~TRINITY_DN13308_c0_g1_i1.p1  ORF type:complete len:590 (+),score=70.99 TRINITY_DN13308_c0_g1_i1:95-1864(+)